MPVALLAAGLAGCSDDDGPTRVGNPATSTSPPTTSAPSSDTSTVPATSAAPRIDEVSLAVVAEVDEPTAMAFSPDGTTAFVTERGGRLWALRRDGERFVVPEGPALDLTDRVQSASTEQGLLGVAVDPSGEALVLDLIEKGGAAGTSVIERYELDADGAGGETVDAGSRTELLRVEQPFTNHNGGHVTFGPDGMLYIGFGDGGSQGDPRGNGQNLGALLAKILRLDVRSGRAQVPPDNPFVDVAGARPEIWLYGVRNPWRFTFDRAEGDMWIGDVGGVEREEVDHLPATGGVDAGRGLNLGWPAREGTAEGTDEVSGSTPVDPVFEYTHDDGCSITGGYVYRGQALPGLVGDYVFGDYCTGTIWALDPDLRSRSLRASTDQLSSFAEDPAGELYALSLRGEILRIQAA